MTQNQVGKQQNLQEFPQRDEKKDRVYRGLSQIVLVPRAGLEPARPNGHMALNHACLPISAPGQCIKKGAIDTLYS